ncbi:MAG TPA: sigma-54 dependent transcriptional regulator [Devosiaceae bacterium]|jgi:two-component system repressor protein LuxO|nr:sigma-54 dependent transcriptional regulator [Devosiaceae bacterium]
MSMPAEHDSHAAARLLLIGHDVAAARALAEELEPCFARPPRVRIAQDGADATASLKAEDYDLVLADLSGLTQLASRTEEAVARLARLAEGALLIVLSDAGSVSAAVAAMRAGAHDCVARNPGGLALANRISELAQRHGKSRALTIRSRGAGGSPIHSGFVGASPQMQVVFEQMEQIAMATAPVFITGESGTGKGVCAEAVHARSARSAGRFVAIGCAAIPQELLERELFGVAPGAYSGAHEGRKGAAELADGGTLYIDEIGALDLSLQAKLLRFLNAGAVQRMGEETARPVDVRMICGTRYNPMQLIADRQFREDLFYRLHVLPIHLPPLRQRASDIPGLASHLLGEISREEHKVFTGFSDEAAARLTANDWPGNVRQLKNLVRRIVVMFEGGEVEAGMVAAAEAVDHHGRALAAGAASAEAPRILPMWQQEQRIIEEAIACFNGNIALAAAALELSPSTIYRKRQTWNLVEGRRGAA